MIKRFFTLGYGVDSSQFRHVAELHRRERQDKFINTVDAVARATGKKIDATAFAKQICRAAAKARGELPDETPRFSNDEHGQRAKMIINAARKARGEEPLK
jgi:hypothetical protein